MVLNARQVAVTKKLRGNLLLVAPAGTGKTNTLAARVAKILEQKLAEPEQILCLTFTNKAAEEMKERIAFAAQKEGLRVCCRTFHGFCYDLIKEEAKKLDVFTDFTVFDVSDCRSILREIIPEEEDVPLSAVQNLIAYGKEQLPFLMAVKKKEISLEEVWEELFVTQTKRIKELCIDEKYHYLPRVYEVWKESAARYHADYDRALEENHGLDFGDLIVRAWKLLQNPLIARRWAARFRYIHVDEMQDTSILEYAILTHIFGSSCILMAGDYFQTIYEWRGSDPMEIRARFLRDYKPEEFILSENYRSTRILIEADYHAIKQLFPAQAAAVYPRGMQAMSEEEGVPIEIKGATDFSEEAYWIYGRILQLGLTDFRKVAILTRSNRYAQNLSSEFRVLGQSRSNDQLPFLVLDDVKFFQRQEIKDALAFLRVTMNKHDAASLVRILTRFGRGIGSATVAKISSPTYRKAGIRITDYIDVDARLEGDPFALLIQGLQEENVVIFDVESTGIDPLDDEIIQIAAIRLDRMGKQKKSFMRYIRAKKSVGKSELVHGISDAFLKEKGEDAEQVLRDFSEFASGSVIVGHNVLYDLRILGSVLSRLKMPEFSYRTYYDTLDIFRRFLPNLKNHTLEYLGQFCKVGHESSHDAFDDILATAEILMFAMNHHILPNVQARKNYMDTYRREFSELAEQIEILRRQAKRLRPWQLLGDIVVVAGIADYYNQRREFQRVENLRDMFRRAKELEDPALSIVDGVEYLLRYTAMSSTDLEAQNAKCAKIPIITIHQAKGAEFDYVFLAGMQEGNFPIMKAFENGRLDEEKRLFYVAITRAKKQLFLTWTQTAYGQYRVMSQFIKALPQPCIQYV